MPLLSDNYLFSLLNKDQNRIRLLAEYLIAIINDQFKHKDFKTARANILFQTEANKLQSSKLYKLKF